MRETATLYFRNGKEHCNEDFKENSRVFYLNDDEVGDQYLLYIKERK